MDSTADLVWIIPLLFAACWSACILLERGLVAAGYWIDRAIEQALPQF